MISIVIPVFNGENSLHELYNKIKTELISYLDYEIIFIHDCGTDRSWEAIKKIKKDDQYRIKGIKFNKNQGQHYATLFGLNEASGDYIFTIDEDSQHDPRYFSQMMKKLKEENLDLLYGKFNKTEQPFLKVFLSALLRNVLHTMIPGLPREYSSYRLIRKDMVNRIGKVEGPVIFLDAELGKYCPKNNIIIMEQLRRLTGGSSYTPRKLFRQSFDFLFKYSKKFTFIYNGLISVLVLSSLGFLYYLIFKTRHFLLFFLLLAIVVLLVIVEIKSLLRINMKNNTNYVDQILILNDKKIEGSSERT